MMGHTITKKNNLMACITISKIILKQNFLFSNFDETYNYQKRQFLMAGITLPKTIQIFFSIM